MVIHSLCLTAVKYVAANLSLTFKQVIKQRAFALFEHLLIKLRLDSLGNLHAHYAQCDSLVDGMRKQKMKWNCSELIGERNR